MDDKTGRDMGMVYQVYLQEERSKSDALVEEAIAGGCQCVYRPLLPSVRDANRHRALILTVDSNVHDFRQSNEKLKGTRGDASPGAKMGVFDDTDKYHDARQCWDDIPRLKELAKGRPIYLKGVCHIDVSPTSGRERAVDADIQDVRLAKEHGLAGCILSNHGGRQLDR
jgi:L-lactate dehydrogenase (cytochrome)